MTSLQQLIESNRLFQVLYDNLPLEMKSSVLYDLVVRYFDKYVHFNKLTIDDLSAYYTKFIIHYNKDCKKFIEFTKYPFEIDQKLRTLPRNEYDVILMLSVLFTEHRFRIMEIIHQSKENGNGLFVGLGPGLEVELSKSNHSKMFAYDISFSDFIYHQFEDIEIHTEYYNGQHLNYFDSIYLIELLEHLEDPIALLQTSCDSLKKKGKIYLTTATNIPQFDHLFNFPEDHTEFEKRIQELGMKVIFSEFIPHNYITLDLKSSNKFYILEKFEE